MFIRYKNITCEKTIDVRSKTEYNQMHLFDYNIPIINEKEHTLIKQFYPKALFIIIYALLKNKKTIKEALLKISDKNSNHLVIGCSRGRLRSPIMFLYAKFLGIKHCKILLGGLKPIYLKKLKSQSYK